MPPPLSVFFSVQVLETASGFNADPPFAIRWRAGAREATSRAPCNSHRLLSNSAKPIAACSGCCCLLYLSDGSRTGRAGGSLRSRAGGAYSRRKRGAPTCCQAWHHRRACPVMLLATAGACQKLPRHQNPRLKESLLRLHHSRRPC